MSDRPCTRCEVGLDIVPGRAICRNCKREDDRAYHLKNRGRRIARMREYAGSYTPSPETLEYQREYRKQHAERYRDHQRRSRAARAGVQVAVIAEDQLKAKIAHWGWRCWVCKSPDIKDMDHVKPISKGGAHLLCNLRPICVTCNRKKGAQWPFGRRTMSSSVSSRTVQKNPSSLSGS